MLLDCKFQFWYRCTDCKIDTFMTRVHRAFIRLTTELASHISNHFKVGYLWIKYHCTWNDGKICFMTYITCIKYSKIDWILLSNSDVAAHIHVPL